MDFEAEVVEIFGDCLDLEVVIGLVLSWLVEASLIYDFLLASSPALTRILFLFHCLGEIWLHIFHVLD